MYKRDETKRKTTVGNNTPMKWLERNDSGTAAIVDYQSQFWMLIVNKIGMFDLYPMEKTDV